jgi:hypothetical protein
MDLFDEGASFTFGMLPFPDLLWIDIVSLYSCATDDLQYLY